MSYKKIRTFSLFLLLGIAALFFPATTLQNSIASGQEYYYPEDKENEYYNQEYNTYSSYNDNKPPVINVEKKLFICNDVIDNSTDFECEGYRLFFEDDEFISFPPGPDSDQYIPCNNEICPFIDESDFGVQIFKDVATVTELSPVGIPVNLDKIHYTVTESDISERLPTDNQCSDVGFTHSLFSEKITNDSIIFNGICVDYVGDCEGTISPGEVKTCTVENYIYEQFTDPIQIVDDTTDDSQSSLLSQMVNKQAIQSQPKMLKDVMNN